MSIALSNESTRTEATVTDCSGTAMRYTEGSVSLRRRRQDTSRLRASRLVISTQREIQRCHSLSGILLTSSLTSKPSICSSVMTVSASGSIVGARYVPQALVFNR